ncbi:MAG: preprotein translocase subunit YajC [Treponema sp.]|nr:preprotein translocase subunit YajC [Treponema sp.]
MSFVPFLQTAAAAPQQGNILMTVLPFVLIIGIFYLFIIRPQNKKQKETEKMISALKKGDKIITIGGIHGVVHQTKEKTVIVKVDDGTKIEFNRSAVASVVVDKPNETKAATKKSEKAKKAAEKTEEVKEAVNEENKNDVVAEEKPAEAASEEAKNE